MSKFRVFTFFWLYLYIIIFGLNSRALGGDVKADVPAEKVELTIEEAQVLQKWNAKDPKKGFNHEDDEGNYYYEQTNDSLEKNVGDDSQIIPKPENYEKGLKSVMSDGSYLFETEESEQKGSFSLHLGAMAAPYILNSEGLEFADIYSNKPINMVYLDYSWQAQKFGKWGFVIGSGIGQSTAPGRFRSNLNETALEEYTIYILPNHLSFSYQFQYTKSPGIVPYFSGGLCGFLFAERRSDLSKTKGVGAGGSQLAGGFKFNLGRIDPHGTFNLESEYGINNIWLDLEYKIVKGFQSN